jgi:hypothetical protein
MVCLLSSLAACVSLPGDGSPGGSGLPGQGGSDFTGPDGDDDGSIGIDDVPVGGTGDAGGPAGDEIVFTPEELETITHNTATLEGFCDILIANPGSAEALATELARLGIGEIVMYQELTPGHVGSRISITAYTNDGTGIAFSRFTLEVDHVGCLVSVINAESEEVYSRD